MAKTLTLVTALRSATKQAIGQTKANFEMDAEDLDQIKEDLAKVSGVAS